MIGFFTVRDVTSFGSCINCNVCIVLMSVKLQSRFASFLYVTPLPPHLYLECLGLVFLHRVRNELKGGQFVGTIVFIYADVFLGVIFREHNFVQQRHIYYDKRR